MWHGVLRPGGAEVDAVREDVDDGAHETSEGGDEGVHHGPV